MRKVEFEKEQAPFGGVFARVHQWLQKTGGRAEQRGPGGHLFLQGRESRTPASFLSLGTTVSPGCGEQGGTSGEGKTGKEPEAR